MLAKLILSIVDSVCGFLSLALLIRFWLQQLRLPFRNPVGQFVIAVTNWMVIPVRRFIPGLFGWDMSSLLLAWLWQAVYVGLKIGVEYGLSDAPLTTLTVSPAPTLAVALMAALDTLKITIYLAMGTVFISAVFSWVNPYAPLADLFNAASRPLLKPFRRYIPLIGGVDLSPLALLLLLQVALSLLAVSRLYAEALLYL